jgi:UDP-2,3-diacylglucosamine pyrophosphatase LpxH
LIHAGQIFVIGDSHIGLADGSETPILAWLDRFVTLQPRALYLNGDLFHYLIADPKFYTRSVERVFARFRELRDGGIEVHYVEGNRDFFLQGTFAEEAVSDIALEYAVQAGPRKYLIVHGDLINDHDYPYRFWRFASKNVVSRVGVRFVPRRMARSFVDSVERRLARSNFKHKSRLPIAQFERYGRERAADGFTDVVFGHFHQKLVLPTPGARITILPPWYETGEAMAIDPASGEFSFVEI